jgi:membrane AbrB-like protein
VLLGASGLGCLVIRALGWVNPWFIGALGTTMALSASGIQLSAMPPELSSAAQLVIGISLGIRFRREFLGQAPRWIAVAVLGTVLSIAVSVGFSWTMVQLTGLNLGTLILGTAPGGIAEMAITAKVLHAFGHRLSGLPSDRGAADRGPALSLALPPRDQCMISGFWANSA